MNQTNEKTKEKDSLTLPTPLGRQAWIKFGLRHLQMPRPDMIRHAQASAPPLGRQSWIKFGLWHLQMPRPNMIRHTQASAQPPTIGYHTRLKSASKLNVSPSSTSKKFSASCATVKNFTNPCTLQFPQNSHKQRSTLHNKFPFAAGRPCFD